MMSRRNRLAVATLFAGGLALAGCATETATRTTTTHPQGTSGSSATGTRTTSTSTGGSSSAPRSRAGTAGKAGAPATGAPETTGIPACDDYLSSYVACHRTAGIYTPDQIEGHYETMRDSLLRDSQDPNIRPQLGARCTSLAQTLRQALHGRSCGPASPAAPASNGSTSR